MAIPASHIVEVLPRVVSGGSSDLELNGLLLSKSDLISASTLVLPFASTTAVGAYFGVDSDEYKAADIYFTSYNNKYSAPSALFIARRVDEPASAWLRSAKNSKTLAQFKAVTNGSMIVSIDSTAQTITGLDLSSASSFSNVAELLQTALGGAATVAYSSLTEAFTITSATSGSDSVLDYASSASSGTDLAAFMGLREADGATLSAGMDTLSINEQMSAITAKTQNFVSFTTLWEAEADEMLEWAAWASSNYGWLYVAYTTNASTLSADSSTDPASQLMEAGHDHTTIVYGSLEYAAFIMGIVASIAWQRVNGTITLAFKAQSGLAALVTDQQTATVLESKNCNYFGNFATRNAEFLFLFPGSLSASDYGFIDPYINSIWLNNRLQVALMDGLSTSGRVPYNQRGYTMIAAWMMDPINEAKNNAAIEAGVVLSERQTSELTNEAGLDISNELWTQGYYVQILDPGASVRARRGSPVVSLWYTYAGAVQRIEVASTAVL